MDGPKVSWSQVHAAAPNADGAGNVIRALVASDIACLGWCEPSECKDWPQPIAPSSAASLNELFPSAPRSFGSAKKHVDPCLAEVAAASLLAGLEKETLDIVSFDRIFVEHLSSRFSIFQKEGWIVDEVGTRAVKRKRTGG